MLGNRNAIATVAVKDLAAARKFYADVLGLKPIAAEGDEVVTFQSGDSKIFVYRSQYAGTNKATVINWVVGNDVDKIVNDLRAKGVKFEHYDLPGLKQEGNVHVGGGMKVAWFKDPDGNILSVVSG